MPRRKPTSPDTTANVRTSTPSIDRVTTPQERRAFECGQLAIGAWTFDSIGQRLTHASGFEVETLEFHGVFDGNDNVDLMRCLCVLAVDQRITTADLGSLLRALVVALEIDDEDLAVSADVEPPRAAVVPISIARRT